MAGNQVRVLIADDQRLFAEALEIAREHGLEETVGPLVEVRLADLGRLAPGSPPPAPPDA